MALDKDIVAPSGATGSYLKITRIEANRRANAMSIWVSVYLNKDARLANAEPLVDQLVQVGEADTATLLEADNTLAAMYTFLKTLDAYSGATDDLDV
jgi:hypothetical protein